MLYQTLLGGAGMPPNPLVASKPTRVHRLTQDLLLSFDRTNTEEYIGDENEAKMLEEQAEIQQQQMQQQQQAMVGQQQEMAMQQQQGQEQQRQEGRQDKQQSEEGQAQLEREKMQAQIMMAQLKQTGTPVGGR